MMVFITTNICMETMIKMPNPLSDGLVEYNDGTKQQNNKWQRML